jgi:TetR/AcrR family transcriptional regulator, tetracycline repressor protein
MAISDRTTREGVVTRSEIVATSLRLIEEYDLSALTMRRLANELGVAVTSIYWHVGNRDALVDLMVEQLLADLHQVHVRGRSPHSRITSLCRQWRRQLWERPHLIALAHERGKTAAMFQPMQAALGSELHAIGLRGKAAATAIRDLQCHVVASVVLERTAERGPVTDITDPAAWPPISDDPALVEALTAQVDYLAVFDSGLAALLRYHLPDPK